MALFVAAKHSAKIVAISLIEEMPAKASMWGDRPVYFILYTYGKEAKPLRFTVDVEGDANGALIDIVLTAKYVHSNLNVLTPHYSQFLQAFPNWAQLTAWLGTCESWTY